MSQIRDSSDSYRDSLATIDKRGKRLWVYPQKPKGSFHRARVGVAVLLLAFMFAAPFVRIGGKPFMLFDILHRKFFIFSIVFWPQDFYILVLLAIALAVFILLFTAAFGRLFCGWVCPQTIFLEMVFRKIEFLIDGSGSKQRKLAAASMTASKLFRRITKHALFIVVAVLLSHVFLSYFIGADAVERLATSSPAEHPLGFAAMMAFTLAFYGIYARFREQVCTLVCPYGRLQSVLLDNNSIVVAYDRSRGEPRAPWRKSEEHRVAGDCIDCLACVRVCPTGIDIRNGTQLECVNCTACIDACNGVMKSVGLPKNLILYSSQDQLDGKARFRVTPRMIIYGAVLLVMLSVVTYTLTSRSSVETTILRTTGQTYETLQDGSIRNLYTVKIINRLPDSMQYTLKLEGNIGKLEVVGPPLSASGFGSVSSVMAIIIPPGKLYSESTLMMVDVMTNGEVLEKVRTSFFGPVSK